MSTDSDVLASHSRAPGRLAFSTSSGAGKMRIFAICNYVQRLIAGSPHLLLEHGAFLGKSTLKSSPTKKLIPEFVVKPLPRVANCKGDFEKPNEKMECSAENAVSKTSLSSAKTGSQSFSYPPYAGNPQPVVTRPDNKMGPWCFHQSPGPQWLVPVMSPSEGLVYKPYLGPGLPGAVYGGHGPFGSTPMPSNFPNSDFGISASHHQGIEVFPGTSPVGHTYIPPYGMPVINPAMSCSAVEQVNQFAGTSPVPGEMVANLNTEQQSSCSVPARENGSESQPRKFQASKGSELQGSTASSPGDRAQGVEIGHNAKVRDPLLLFPRAPVVPEDASQPHEAAAPPPPQVIKVVPHNPRSATESAARIFRFIQEERKQYNLV
ncbi:hypothetical protein L484_019541 [Morus notabilis]|uniref:Protein EARLY FLOWERING 3 n=1 Tax=Morus notabilis TaxID=981085 RepID=W9RBS6_9ROSA|nr:hypothetical protein L484_019541 [Morus notabilis]